MWLRKIIWIDKFTIKIQDKHNLTIDEVEDALLSGAIFRRASRGKVRGENVYVAYGKTNGGRYLFIVFIYKQSMEGEEAAEFWESHDSTDYLDILEEVEIKVDLQKRHYLIELDEDSAKLLQEDAKEKGVSADYLASKLVEKELARA